MIEKISNWGKYPVEEVEMSFFDHLPELQDNISALESVIARGNGRCYGDSSLGNHVISTLKFNKILSFDRKTGIMECQSGITFEELLEVLVPAGWFLPVTPGTKFITLGGAVASDIHGKNHHKEGSFSSYVEEFTVLCSDGQVYECSSSSHPDLFQATIGGMGLTGIILKVKFRLKKIETAYIAQKRVKAANIDEILDLFEKYDHYTYSVAWIDCLKRGKNMGRSILMLGEHAKVEDLPKKMQKKPLDLPSGGRIAIPFDLPALVLNRFSIGLFNELFYRKVLKKEINDFIHYDPYFYPLDNILEWNRMYGKEGFVQYQFVVPLDKKEGLVRVIEKITKKKIGSFLAVLKVFGEQDGLISFPKKGYTLALDFPIRKGLMEFLDELDEIVLENDGRIYLTKDARMKQEVFWSSYPRSKEFLNIIKQYNPSDKFKSTQSNRLNIT